VVIENKSRWASRWGISGVTTLLLFAVYRIWPDLHVVFSQEYTPQAYLLLLFCLPLMLYWEGYLGFHRRFAPRIVSRAKALEKHGNIIHKLLAPLFCMGFIYSPRRRKVSLAVMTLAIFGLVALVKSLNEPWRGVIDLSVALALLMGVTSIIWLDFRTRGSSEFLCDPELP